MANFTSARQQANEKIAEQLLAQMEQGIIPWRKPWDSFLPSNVVSGKGYRGVNIFILSDAKYADHRWLTFNQAKDLGGNVKKGERGRTVYFWKIFRNEATAEGEKGTSIPMLKTYTVFNFEQCENLTKAKTLDEITKARHDANPIEVAEKFIASLPWAASIKMNAGRACWSPSDPDAVNMPRPETFKSMHHYYATLFHELVHASGYSTRLDRKTLAAGGFGSEIYSVEELVAEFGAAMICSQLGIDNTELTENAVAYLQNWGDVIRMDKKIIMEASGMAQKAVDYLMQNYNAKETAEEDTDEEAIAA